MYRMTLLLKLLLKWRVATLSKDKYSILIFNYFQSELCSSMTSQDSSIVSAEHSIIYHHNHKDRTFKELLKQKIILFDNNETRL